MREWKPGDLGVTAKGTLALRRPNTSDGWIDSRGAPWSTDKFPDNVRPLVVIDPEDREQIERLAAAIRETRPDASMTDLAAALRSLIEPPKPPEPQGLGAVVEDADDSRWIRIWGPGIKVAWVGSRGGQDPDETVRYDDITAVRVLSEGVS